MQRCPDRPTIRISAEAMAQLWEYDWPGNVRELENLIERLCVLADDPVIRADDLPLEVRTFISEKRIPRPHLPEDGIDLNKAVLDFEQRLITEALRRTKGNKQAAARLLVLDPADAGPRLAADALRALLGHDHVEAVSPVAQDVGRTGAHDDVGLGRDHRGEAEEVEVVDAGRSRPVPHARHHEEAHVLARGALAHRRDDAVVVVDRHLRWDGGIGPSANQ